MAIPFLLSHRNVCDVLLLLILTRTCFPSNFSYSNTHEVILFFVYIWISVTIAVGSLLICLLTICMSSLVAICWYHLLALHWVVCFLWLSVKPSLHILHRIPLSDMEYSIFYPSVWLLLCPNRVFHRAKNFNEIKLFNISFLVKLIF